MLASTLYLGASLGAVQTQGGQDPQVWRDIIARTAALLVPALGLLGAGFALESQLLFAGAGAALVHCGVKLPGLWRGALLNGEREAARKLLADRATPCEPAESTQTVQQRNDKGVYYPGAAASFGLMGAAIGSGAGVLVHTMGEHLTACTLSRTSFVCAAAAYYGLSFGAVFAGDVNAPKLWRDRNVRTALFLLPVLGVLGAGFAVDRLFEYGFEPANRFLPLNAGATLAFAGASLPQWWQRTAEANVEGEARYRRLTSR